MVSPAGGPGAAGWIGRWVGLVAGGVLALLALGPLLGRGYVLTYDMVFVPRLELTRGLLGLDTAVARAVPADLLVALASRLAPADLVQKLVLAGVFAGAAAGAARLVPSRSLAAQAAASPGATAARPAPSDSGRPGSAEARDPVASPAGGSGAAGWIGRWVGLVAGGVLALLALGPLLGRG
ncbi:MAG TPA: hypothetical protein VG411_00715, partial [Actinomycetota bacterium]|nr:hypothetical protein [Actinomycetota bacterium]